MDEAIGSHVWMYITLGGSQIPFITDAVVITWLIMAVIAVLVLVFTRNLQVVPVTGRQKAAEALVDFIRGLCKTQIGEKWRDFVPYIGTVLIYLAVANLCGLFNILPSGETLAAWTGIESLSHLDLAIHPPTKNFNVTLCLAIMTIVVVIGAKFRYQGAKGVLRGLYKPTPVSGFVEILDLFVRPLSLCLRLFGNVMGATIVMTLIYNALPLVLPVVVAIYFELFDGLLQAYVFVFLTMIYLQEAVGEED